MDSKQTAERVFDRIYCQGSPASGFREHFVKVATEELEAAAKPPEKVKSRGDAVAEKCVSVFPSMTLLQFHTSNRWEMTPHGMVSRPSGEVLLYEFGKLIDAERADAAKAERELHQFLIRDARDVLDSRYSRSLNLTDALGRLSAALHWLDSQYAKGEEGNAQ